jgi:hypothetical protein
MKIFFSPVRNALLIGVAAGFLAIAGYLLMWALWYALAPHPYSLYVVNARALQEGLFMLLIVPAVTAIFVLATNVRYLKTSGDAVLSAAVSGMVAGAVIFIAAVAGLFTLFFGLVPGPFQCEPVMFCGGTSYDWMINDPLPLYYLGPHGGMLTPLQGALSVLFDVLVVAFRSMLIPAFLTMIFAIAIFYLLPQIYHIFEDNEKHNLEKALVTFTIGLVVFTVIIIPPIAFVCL